MNPRTRRLVGRQQPTPRRVAKPRGLKPLLQLPHERDQSIDATATAPDPKMLQAKRDIEAGQVDTDMRATPGLDAKRRAQMVPDPGGEPQRPAKDPSIEQ
jgi:hypothetical protein